MAKYVRLAEFNPDPADPIEVAVLTAVYNSMIVVYEGMCTVGLIDPTAKDKEAVSAQKSDGSLITRYDRESERVASEVIATLAPHVLFRGEEGTRSGSNESGLVVGYDPNDGTRTFVTGGTDATVIATVYNPDNSIYGAAIGQPSTGRIYSAFGEQRTQGRLIELADEHTAITKLHIQDITTWGGSLSQKGQVFIDNNRPHPRNGHNTLTKEQHLQIRAKLLDHDIGVLERGSNGNHQVVVASGRDRAAAALSTVRGIWEDTTAGVFLTDRSGGATQLYTVIEGVITPVTIDVLDYDMALVANNPTTLAFIHELLMETSVDPETFMI